LDYSKRAFANATWKNMAKEMRGKEKQFFSLLDTSFYSFTLLYNILDQIID